MAISSLVDIVQKDFKHLHEEIMRMYGLMQGMEK
jgi:hypothetical protein